jgi:hypothetical protein
LERVDGTDAERKEMSKIPRKDDKSSVRSACSDDDVGQSRVTPSRQGLGFHPSRDQCRLAIKGDDAILKLLNQPGKPVG